jgi:hypothetical protein
LGHFYVSFRFNTLLFERTEGLNSLG